MRAARAVTRRLCREQRRLDLRSKNGVRLALNLVVHRLREGETGDGGPQNLGLRRLQSDGAKLRAADGEEEALVPCRRRNFLCLRASLFLFKWRIV